MLRCGWAMVVLLASGAKMTGTDFVFSVPQGRDPLQGSFSIRLDASWRSVDAAKPASKGGPVPLNQPRFVHSTGVKLGLKNVIASAPLIDGVRASYNTWKQERPDAYAEFKAPAGKARRFTFVRPSASGKTVVVKAMVDYGKGFGDFSFEGKNISADKLAQLADQAIRGFRPGAR